MGSKSSRIKLVNFTHDTIHVVVKFDVEKGFSSTTCVKSGETGIVPCLANATSFMIEVEQNGKVARLSAGSSKKLFLVKMKEKVPVIQGGQKFI